MTATSSGRRETHSYVISEGEVEVVADGALVTTLGRGALFGEIALLYDIPRNGTVRTRSEAHLYTLKREIFLVTLTGQVSAVGLAHGLANERLAELQALREARTLSSPR